MYKISKVISNVSKFCLGNKELVYQRSDGSLLLNDMLLENFVQQIEVTLFNRIFINDWEGNFSIYDWEGNLVDKGINQAFFCVSDDLVGRQYLESNKVYESLMDKTNHVIFEIEFNKYNSKNSVSRNYYFLLNSKRDIVCFNLKNSREQWTANDFYKSQQSLEVHKFLCVFQNDLLVVLSDSSILRIDIESGEVKEQFKMILFFGSENEVIAQYNFIQFQDSKLIYYRYGQYAEYDLIENKIIYEFDIKEKLEYEKLHDNIDSYIKEDDVLYYYISGFGSFSLPSIVVLNIRTKEIVWKYIWDNPDVFYKDFQKSEIALYLLDSENTLHIFEKE